MPHSVSDYILQAKHHMRAMSQDIEAGRSMASHYIDVPLVQRQILIGTGKNASKCLEKELVVLGDTERRRSLLARTQVFQNSVGTKPKHSVVLLGNAGMGKTTFIKKLCLDWSDGLLPQFDFVFLLDGKTLTLPPDQTYSLQSLLLHLSSSALPDPRPRPQAVFNRVLSAPERVLVIFDGFEAVRDLEGLTQCPAVESRGQSYSVRQLFSGLLQQRILPGCSVLLSARPQGTVSGLLRRADSLLELPGFCHADIERYVRLYFSGHSLQAQSSAPNPVSGLAQRLDPVSDLTQTLDPVSDLPPSLDPVLGLNQMLDPDLDSAQTLDPDLASAQMLDPDLASAQTLDPDLASAQTLDPDFASAQMLDPDFASAQMPDPDFASAQMPDPDLASAQTLDPDLVSAQMLNPDLVSAQMLDPDLASAHMLDPDFASAQMLDQYLASAQTLDPDFASAQTLDPDFASAQTLDPDLSSSQTLDPDLASAQTLDPDLASAQTLDPDLASAQTLDPDLASAQTLDPDLASAQTLDPDLASAQTLDPDVASAQTLDPVPARVLAELQNHSYLMSLCWNPALCHMVCLLLEHRRDNEPLPSTLTGVCYNVLGLMMRLQRSKHTHNPENTHTQTHTHIPENTHTQTQTRIPENTQTHTHSPKQTPIQNKPQKRTKTQNQTHTKSPEQGEKNRCRQKDNPTQTQMRTRSWTHTTLAEEERGGKGEEDENYEEDRHFLSELSGVAWDGVKGHTSLLTLDNCISIKQRGLTTGLIHSYWLRGCPGRDCGNDDNTGDNILSWSSPFMQSFLGGAYLSISKCVSDRTLISQILPPPRGRRRLHLESLDLAQRFAVGLLFRKKAELRDLAILDDLDFDAVVAKQLAVATHMKNLLNLHNLTPARLLEACHCVYETGEARQLVPNLPEVLSFRSVPLTPPDAVVVWTLLEQCRTQKRRFCLWLEDTGLSVSGLRLLTGLSNIHSYRACIADTIAMWEELDRSGEEELLKRAVSKLTINPFRATQVSHVQHLARLVSIHTQRRLPDSQSDVLEDGIPAVTDLHKLELELGPVNGPLALPKLLELLPSLHSLQHLDLEKSKLGDSGAEGLAEAIRSLSALEILNLSQNHISDPGMRTLAPALGTLPSLHCLSLYSNVISDEGAESLAAVLPQITTLSDIDVKYNKFTMVGAHSLGSSLKNCPWVKSLGLWNQCIPYGVLERLREQDTRIQLL